MMYTVRFPYKISGNPGYGQGDILNSRVPQVAIGAGYAYNPGQNYLSSIRSDIVDRAFRQAVGKSYNGRLLGGGIYDFQTYEVDFIAKYPGHPLVANAQYWIGEAYYVQRDYRQALTEFHKVLDTAPGSAKAADALLKIGLAHRSLRDDKRARQSWQRVVREFPRSEAAAKAKVFLK